MPIRLGMRSSLRIHSRDHGHALSIRVANRWFDADQVHDIFNDGNDDDRAEDAGETADAAAQAGAAKDSAGEYHQDRSLAEIGDDGLQTADFEEAANGGGK